MEKTIRCGSYVSATRVPSGQIFMGFSGGREELKHILTHLFFEFLQRRVLSYEDIKDALSTALVHDIAVSNLP